MVYIAEAHSVDGWQTASNEAEDIRIVQARTLKQRLAAATLCTERLGLSIPTLVDDMADTARQAFSAWPERLFVVNAGGLLHYCGGPGPYEFHPSEARRALIELC